MKNKLIIFIFIILLVPSLIHAETYNYIDSVEKCNKYIELERYRDKDKYLLAYPVPFIYSETGRNVDSDDFKFGGLLNKKEYELSVKNEKSYLNSGSEYWLSTSVSGFEYYISNGLKYKDKNEKSNIRVTEFVNKDTEVVGTGSKDDPWVFNIRPMITLTTTNSEYGLINNESEVTLKTIPFKNNYYVEFELNPKEGYEYKSSNGCRITYVKDNTYRINSIMSDTKCNIEFGLKTYALSFRNRDDYIKKSSPETIYFRYSDGFYSDKELTKSFNKLSVIPEFEGYIFDGYYHNNILIIDQNGNLKIDEHSDIFNNSEVNYINLDVKWKLSTYTISYNANGGSGKMNDQVFSYNESNRLNTNTFTRKGYTFLGWSLTKNGTKNYENGEIVTNIIKSGKVTLYALWEENTYTIIYNSNGGTGYMEEQTFKYTESKPLSKNQFFNDGYAFLGWSNTPNGKPLLNDQAVVKGLIEYGKTNLYAVWTKNSYSVIFNSNGGSGSMSNQVFGINEEKTLSPNTFTKTGYSFVGWGLTKDANKVLVDKQKVKGLTLNESITLYAIWRPNTYTVIFNANGGSGSMNYQTLRYDESRHLLPCGFSKNGSTCIGWATSPNGYILYTNNQEVLNLTDSGTITLYAIYR